MHEVTQIYDTYIQTFERLLKLKLNYLIWFYIILLFFTPMISWYQKY